MKLLFSIGPWLMELFDPPPRDSLSFWQKIGRVLLVTITLITLCIITALVLAVLFFLVQKGHDALSSMPQLKNALLILGVSIAVNLACVLALLQIKRLDRRLIPPAAK